MQTSNYWNQFEKTGRIEDYLAYVQKQEEGMTAEHLSQNDSALQGSAGNSGGQMGDNPYAGIRERNGNHIEADAYRGIR